MWCHELYYFYCLLGMWQFVATNCIYLAMLAFLPAIGYLAHWLQALYFILHIRQRYNCQHKSTTLLVFQILMFIFGYFASNWNVWFCFYYGDLCDATNHVFIDYGRDTTANRIFWMFY